MSLLDDVSIVVTPNGYKAGTLYGVIPVPTEGSDVVVDGNFPTPNVNWNLGSNWSIGGGLATRTSGVTSNLSQVISGISGKLLKVSYTVSSYGGSGWIGASPNGSDYNENTGNDTFTDYITPTSDNLYIRASYNFSGSITNISVKEYTAADMDVTRATDATRVDEDGLIADVLSNVPRIDYTGGGCPHILAEPQRTNLVTYSEDFSDSYWTKNNTSVTSGISSPSADRPLGAYELVGQSSTAEHYIKATSFANTATDYSFKGYVKYNNWQYVHIGDGGDSSWHSVTLDLINGTVIGTTSILNATIEPIINGWFEYSISFTRTNATTIQLSMAFANSTHTSSKPTTTTLATSSIEFFATQCEQGSYATSYIPTDGSTVTRNQDQFSRDGIGSLIGQTEGTFFAEISKPVLSFATQSLISLNNAASNSDANGITIGFDAGDDFFIRVQSNNVLVFQETETTAAANTFYKVAISYKSGGSLMYLNGSPLTPSAGSLAGAFTLSTTLDNLSFDINGNNGLPFYGSVRQLQVYDTELSPTQLAALTT